MSADTNLKLGVIEPGLIFEGKLGKYVLERPLGRGGMGEVWSAKALLGHRFSERKYAVKFPLDERNHERFEREINVLARLQNDTVVNVVDHGEEPCSFFVMDRLEGETLAERLSAGSNASARARRAATDAQRARELATEAAEQAKQAREEAREAERRATEATAIAEQTAASAKREEVTATQCDDEAKRLKVSPKLVARILHQIAAAVDDAHEKQILHRDLKPSNIFLAVDAASDEGVAAKLLDFGIAKDFSSAPVTIDGSRLGTIAYASPEQLMNASRVTLASEIWSLGVIGYEAIVGENPFSALVEYESREKILAIETKALEVPEDCESQLPGFTEWIQRMTAFSPDNRYSNATDAMGKLLEICGLERPARVRRVGDTAAANTSEDASDAHAEVLDGRDESEQGYANVEVRPSELIQARPVSRPAEPRRYTWPVPLSLSVFILAATAFGGGSWALWHFSGTTPDASAADQPDRLTGEPRIHTITPLLATESSDGPQPQAPDIAMEVVAKESSISVEGRHAGNRKKGKGSPKEPDSAANTPDTPSHAESPLPTRNDPPSAAELPGAFEQPSPSPTSTGTPTTILAPMSNAALAPSVAPSEPPTASLGSAPSDEGSHPLETQTDPGRNPSRAETQASRLTGVFDPHVDPEKRQRSRTKTQGSPPARNTR